MTRDGPPVRLPAGEPANPCEEGRFLELVPSVVFARGQQSDADATDIILTTEEVRAAGLGIYRRGDPVLLPEILPELEETRLTRHHLNRIEPIIEKMETQRTWAWISAGSAVALLVPSTTLIVVGSSNEGDGLLIAGAVGLGATVLVEVLSLALLLAYEPTRQEQIDHQIRSRLLLEGEDDLTAAARGVNRYNERARVGCR